MDLNSRQYNSLLMQLTPGTSAARSYSELETLAKRTRESCPTSSQILDEQNKRRKENSRSNSIQSESVGKRPPKDMKRLDKNRWYTIARVARWGETPCLQLTCSQTDSNGGESEATWCDETANLNEVIDMGFFKPPAAYLKYKFRVGDKIKLESVGYSKSRNKVAVSIIVESSTKDQSKAEDESLLQTKTDNENPPMLPTSQAHRQHNLPSPLFIPNYPLQSGNSMFFSPFQSLQYQQANQMLHGFPNLLGSATSSTNYGYPSSLMFPSFGFDQIQSTDLIPHILAATSNVTPAAAADPNFKFSHKPNEPS